MSSDELRRVDQILGQLGVALTLMEPAWSGLKERPDMDELNDQINELRSAISAAHQRARFLRSDLSRFPEGESVYRITEKGRQEVDGE